MLFFYIDFRLKTRITLLWDKWSTPCPKIEDVHASWEVDFFNFNQSYIKHINIYNT